MKKRFLFFVNVCTVISGVVGAGFATGQEILLYFGGANPILCATICALFYFLFFSCAVFMNFSPTEGKDKISKLQVFSKKTINLFTEIACFVILCAMLSAMKSILKDLFDDFWVITLLGIVLVLFCVVIVFANNNGLKLVGVLFTTVFILSFVIIGFLAKDFTILGNVKGSVSKSFLYVSLNSIFLIDLLSESCANFKIGTKLSFCLTCSLICGFLIFFAIACVNQCGFDSLPLLKIAFVNEYFGKFYSIVLLLGIVTTVVASALPLVKRIDGKVSCRILSTLILFAFAWIVSLLDFGEIVEKFYPLLSIFGIVIILLSVINLFTSKKKIII